MRVDNIGAPQIASLPQRLKGALARRRALESAGVEFVAENGVRLRALANEASCLARAAPRAH